MEDLEIALRCYTTPKDKKESNWKGDNENELPKRVLVFDTETTTDQYQNLTFGSFQIYEHRKAIHCGIFYNPTIAKDQLDILNKYSKIHDLSLYTLRGFVDTRFLPEVYDLHTLCVGFNLPFDLSRLALSWSKARKQHNAFSFKLSNNIMYSRLIIKHIDSTKSFIQFTNSFNKDRGNVRHRKGKPNTFNGNFLDLRTLTFALTNEEHTLKSACELFHTEHQKIDTETHGRITPEYIEYNLNDVKATYSLYLKLKEEYSRYNLDKPVTKVYSPASIGKAYLNVMGVKSFLEKNPDFPKEILGYVMSMYYGGRTEVKIRKTPTQIALIDFMSMYPTVCTLQNLWQFVICNHVKYFDDTDNVRKFIDEITLNKLQNKDTWKQLNAIVKVLPNEDILPVRAIYGKDKNTYNIGLNYLSSETPIWYTLSDVIASKLLTCKAPKILNAIRFKPIGIQERLKSIKIIGDIPINPVKNDLFKCLIEHRHKLKEQGNNLQNIIKIISNSTSYGIFVEINSTHKKKQIVDVYGLEHFTNQRDTIETFGNSFNPIIATLITSASRLILGITEAILSKHNETYAFCDTDSMAIPPEYVREIQNYFQKLNPYSFNEPVFKLEKENYGENNSKELELLYFYGISAKRYVLYNLRNNEPYIRKFSSHGLGHLLNPFNKNNNEGWHGQIWYAILNEYYKLVQSEELYNKYSNRYAISQFTLSSPHLMNRLKLINKHQSYDKQIKPFNFVLIGVGSKIDETTNKVVKPIASYNKNYQRVVYDKFTDYHTGKIMKGKEYWKPMDSIFFDYKNHPESKFDGDKGILKRKHIKVKNITYIGKESNKLEESEVLGVNEDSYQKYINPAKMQENLNMLNNLILSLKPKLAKRYGVSKKQLMRMRGKIRNNKPLRLTQKTKIRLSKIIKDKN